MPQEGCLECLRRGVWDASGGVFGMPQERYLGCLRKGVCNASGEVLGMPGGVLGCLRKQQVQHQRWSVEPSKPAIAQLVEHQTVECCSNLMVPGSIPGG